MRLCWMRAGRRLRALTKRPAIDMATIAIHSVNAELIHVDGAGRYRRDKPLSSSAMAASAKSRDIPRPINHLDGYICCVLVRKEASRTPGWLTRR